MKKKPTPQTPPAAATAVPRDAAARIVKRVHVDRVARDAARRALAGTYRVIHGSFAVPKKPEEYLNPDGSEIPGAPKVDYAIPGDEIYLGDADAARALDADLIERLTVPRSRLGKVWAPPPVIKNAHAGTRA